MAGMSAAMVIADRDDDSEDDLGALGGEGAPQRRLGPDDAKQADLRLLVRHVVQRCGADAAQAEAVLRGGRGMAAFVSGFGRRMDAAVVVPLLERWRTDLDVMVAMHSTGLAARYRNGGGKTDESKKKKEKEETDEKVELVTLDKNVKKRQRNRRFAKMKQLLREGFFDELNMAAQFPLLYQDYVGRYNADSSRVPNRPVPSEVRDLFGLFEAGSAAATDSSVAPMATDDDDDDEEEEGDYHHQSRAASSSSSSSSSSKPTKAEDVTVTADTILRRRPGRPSSFKNPVTEPNSLTQLLVKQYEYDRACEAEQEQWLRPAKVAPSCSADKNNNDENEVDDAERHRLLVEFFSIVLDRFMNGEFVDVDYNAIDRDESLDDRVEEERDREDAYFNE
eukprot:TRINITY_DN67725_c12_g3_i1.p2 TRINITY_DN67725_c12_g3~~TRINITY_DN67725_c12_g3_i1.p2  ORF type:complete len:393 (+),score=184.06 TRINITY_DN67725_c12_g3_i1:44-1222(+)